MPPKSESAGPDVGFRSGTGQVFRKELGGTSSVTTGCPLQHVLGQHAGFRAASSSSHGNRSIKPLCSLWLKESWIHCPQTLLHLCPEKLAPTMKAGLTGALQNGPHHLMHQQLIRPNQDDFCTRCQALSLICTSEGFVAWM